MTKQNGRVTLKFVDGYCNVSLDGKNICESTRISDPSFAGNFTADEMEWIKNESNATEDSGEDDRQHSLKVGDVVLLPVVVKKDRTTGELVHTMLHRPNDFTHRTQEDMPMCKVVENHNFSTKLPVMRTMTITGKDGSEHNTRGVVGVFTMKEIPENMVKGRIVEVSKRMVRINPICSASNSPEDHLYPHFKYEERTRTYAPEMLTASLGEMMDCKKKSAAVEKEVAA